MLLPEYEIEPCIFDSAKDLYDFLDESNPIWQDGKWIFRGQNDATWDLYPKALRPCNLIDDFVEFHYEKQYWVKLSDPSLYNIALLSKIEFYTDPVNGKALELYINEVLSRVGDALTRQSLTRVIREVQLYDIRRNVVHDLLHQIRERHLVWAFAQRADQIGLYVPSDRFANTWDTPYPYGDQLLHAMVQNEPNIPHEYAGIAFALAQHHGIPTRLLDWTYRQHVAAYFAASVEESEKCKSECKEEPEHIAVWAVERSQLSNVGLKPVTHRRGDIGFLQAQDGVLVFDTEADFYYQVYGEWVPFDYKLHEIKVNRPKSVYKFIFPYKRREDLLDLLGQRRISKPFLMPTYDNVAQEILDEEIRVEDILGN